MWKKLDPTLSQGVYGHSTALPLDIHLNRINKEYELFLLGITVQGPYCSVRTILSQYRARTPLDANDF